MPVEWKTISLLAPESLLVLAASAIFVAGAFTRSRAWWALAACVTYIGAGVLLAGQSPVWQASGPIVIDPLGLGLRWLALLVGLLFTATLARLADDELASEQFGCLMLIAAGLMLVASANELVLLFLGFELISIPTYVLLFLGRRTRSAGEATMKYFYLSILSSALLLYGFCFLFGLGKTTLLTGTAEVPGIREALSQSTADNPLAALAPLALALIFAGLGFKLTIAPLQFYAPDVYQGTTSVNAGLLAVAPKIAGVAGFIRLVVVTMPLTSEFAWRLALILAIATMTIGNVSALWQRNIRRLLAYSSIAHGGYLLIGLAAASAASVSPEGAARGGITAMLLYIVVYALATLGAFAALAYLSSTRRDVNDIDELGGLARTEPMIAGALAVFMFSLAGLPPLAGFWGKLSLFTSAIELATAGPSDLATWFTILAIAGGLNAAIAAAYYLRIVAVMYFQPVAARAPAAGGPTARWAAVACALLVVLAGAWPTRLFDLAVQSEAVLQPSRQSVRADSPPPAIARMAAVGRAAD